MAREYWTLIVAYIYRLLAVENVPTGYIQVFENYTGIFQYGYVIPWAAILTRCLHFITLYYDHVINNITWFSLKKGVRWACVFSAFTWLVPIKCFSSNTILEKYVKLCTSSYFCIFKLREKTESYTIEVKLEHQNDKSFKFLFSWKGI